MLSKFKITFTENTEVEFINPDTMKKEWYKCYYGRGTSMEVADLLSGNTQRIFAICADGEIVFMNTMVVRIESL
jgi:hypothetical protein